jgi:hypothetical protein
MKFLLEVIRFQCLRFVTLFYHIYYFCNLTSFLKFPHISYPFLLFVILSPFFTFLPAYLYFKAILCATSTSVFLPRPVCVLCQCKRIGAVFSIVGSVTNWKVYIPCCIIPDFITPCGGGSEYFHRSPCES